MSEAFKARAKDIVIALKISEMTILPRRVVEALASVPYDDPGFIPSTLLRRELVKLGFLEIDPTSSRKKPRVRCTEAGSMIVQRYRRAGWI